MTEIYGGVHSATAALKTRLPSLASLIRAVESR